MLFQEGSRRGTPSLDGVVENSIVSFPLFYLVNIWIVDALVVLSLFLS